MTIWRRANVTTFRYMTLWLLFIASILNILSSHDTLLKSFLYAAHCKNNKTLSNSGRKHSRPKSHNKEGCHTRKGGWGRENSSVHGKCHSRTSEESEAGAGDGSQNTHHLMRWNQWPLWSGSESWKRWVMERILLNKRQQNMPPNEAPHYPPSPPPTSFTVLSAAQKCLSCTFTVSAIWGVIRFLSLRFYETGRTDIF